MIQQVQNISNRTVTLGELYSGTDIGWILICGFLILTMQSGFGLLEAGCVSSKNVATIMIKNVIDVVFGGICYWFFGYALSFGREANAVLGFEGFMIGHQTQDHEMGSRYAHYFLQLSFCAGATTIVSGAVAERIKIHSYIIFAILNILTYSFPASWIWNPKGFLVTLGYYDFAGVTVVHLNGGTAALMFAVILGPRLGRFKDNDSYGMTSPTTALSGVLMLWWAWFGFNCSSSMGLDENRYKITALVAVNTINGAIGFMFILESFNQPLQVISGGGIIGFLLTMSLNKGVIIIGDVINGLLGGLVSVTGIASVTSTWESFIIGAIGAFVAIGMAKLIELIKIDDPVGAIPVHFGCGIWGSIAVGLFSRDNILNHLNNHHGLFHGGGGYLLGIQLLGVVTVIAWSVLLTGIWVMLLKYTIGIRMSESEEILGADWVYHKVQPISLTRSLTAILNETDKQIKSPSSPNNDSQNGNEGEMRNTLKQLVLMMSKKSVQRKITPRHAVFTIDNGNIQQDDPPTFSMATERPRALRVTQNGFGGQRNEVINADAD